MRRVKFKKPYGREAERERFRAVLQSEAYRRNRDGEMSTHDYVEFMTGTEEDKVIDDVMYEVQHDTNKCFQNGYSFSWDDVIQWVSDHWLDILKIVLSVAILFLEPKPEDSDEQ